eukprot:scaffold2204_cov106-Isochrysis_galbana.AAC.1
MALVAEPERVDERVLPWRRRHDLTPPIGQEEVKACGRSVPQTQQSADAEERASLKKLGAIAFGEPVAPRHGASPRVCVERLHGERAGTADPPHVNDVASRRESGGNDDSLPVGADTRDVRGQLSATRRGPNATTRKHEH